MTKQDSSQLKTIPHTQEISILSAIDLAGQHIEAGNLQAAESILQAVLNKHPQNAHALHLLGIIAHKIGKTELALELTGKAINIRPDISQFHANRGEMCRLANRIDEAIFHGEQAIRHNPDNANAHSNLGIAYYDKKDYTRAEMCQITALKINPQLLTALNNLGSIKRNQKEKEKAIEYYQRALEIQPDYQESINNMGAVLTELERPEEALQLLAKVITLKPNYADAHQNIGNAFLLLENYEKAELAYNNTLNLSPNNPAALLGMARVYKEMDLFEQATELAQRSLMLSTDKAESYALLGDIHTKNGEYTEAENYYNQALTSDPDSTSAVLGKGQIQMELGKISEAEKSFKHAMQIDPKEISPYILIAQAKKITKNSDVLKRLKNELTNSTTMMPTRALSLHFALGKAYDDINEYDQAFTHFSEGCRIKRSRIQYDANQQDLIRQNICQIFTEEKIKQLAGNGNPDSTPIFVLGMPRSGTTLVETILASHPLVSPGGELRHLLETVNLPNAASGLNYPLNLLNMNVEDINLMAEHYLNKIKALTPDAIHITDKMPANFLALGLIHLMLPNAKIIHVKRNPMDVCLSGFTKLFNNSQYHSYDLTEMGRYYVNYAKVMEHWRTVLPQNAFFEIEYEQLVQDKENQIKKMLTYCQLEWHDDCMTSHKTERSVKTASITQVRQPVYTSSVERWRHYEKHLQPLFNALGEYADVNKSPITPDNG